jgi:hypothetical protein
MKLKCHFLEIYISFVMCWLAGFQEVWGLDKIIRAGTEEGKSIKSAGLWPKSDGHGLSLHITAFAGTDPIDEPIISGLPMIRAQSRA